MKRFKFFLQRSYWMPRIKTKTKEVIIEADDLALARKVIEFEYPGWEVSMFWPVV